MKKFLLVVATLASTAALAGDRYLVSMTDGHEVIFDGCELTLHKGKEMACAGVGAEADVTLVKKTAKGAVIKVVGSRTFDLHDEKTHISSRNGTVIVPKHGAASMEFAALRETGIDFDAPVTVTIKKAGK